MKNDVVSLGKELHPTWSAANANSYIGLFSFVQVENTINFHATLAKELGDNMGGAGSFSPRSEERRVGQECRSRGSP